MTTTWVITSKSKEQGIVTKARLVVRGFQEDTENIRSDSPTCSKEGVRLMLALIVARQWKICSLDVKAAFLQGKSIEREVYIMPPKEFRKSSVLWKLKKVAYGLTDASRSWYLRVKEVLIGLGMKICQYEEAVFYYRSDELDGILIIHVDDMLYAGTESFHNEVLSQFKNTFHISKEETGCFKYVGIDMRQEKNCIRLGQKDYIMAMKEEILNKSAMVDKKREADEFEIQIFRQAVGSLGWVTNTTRPEFSFVFSLLGCVQSKSTIADFHKYMKAVRELKALASTMVIAKIDMKTIKLVVYSDASMANRMDGNSQIGYIIFLCDVHNNCAPVAWSSKKSRRVARSTIAAETMAATDALDAAFVQREILQKILQMKLPPILLRVDNKSLCDLSKTTNTPTEKRLVVDICTDSNLLIHFPPVRPVCCCEQFDAKKLLY